MIQESLLRQLLEPFGLDLTPAQFRQLITYLDLLLRWNRHQLSCSQSPSCCMRQRRPSARLCGLARACRGPIIDRRRGRRCQRTCAFGRSSGTGYNVTLTRSARVRSSTRLLRSVLVRRYGLSRRRCAGGWPLIVECSIGNEPSA